MRYFSTFSGIGGFELGIAGGWLARNGQADFRVSRGQKAKHGAGNDNPQNERPDGRALNGTHPECVGYSEIDKYAIQIYEKHFPHKNYGDITKIDERGLPDFDLLCGGFPCQSFSIAGKRGGFEDTRGTLFFDIARIAKAKKPLFLLLENVKGLVSHDKGKTLETILATLQELGYYVNYEIYNSKDHGVPQNRERIFFLCTRINALVDDGLAKTTKSSERLIQEWLFQILLNNLEEAKRLQGHESKDWVLGYLLCLEIARNQKSLVENTSDGITVPMAGSTSLFGVAAPWQNIAIWLSKESVANLNDTKSSTISTAISEITESETYTFSQMFRAILLATVRLRESSKNSWNEVLSSLILVEEDTKYERINSADEKVVVSESGSMHKSENLEKISEHFIIGHLRGTSRPKVFPFGENDGKDNELPRHISNTLIGESKQHAQIRQMNHPKHSNDRVYGDKGLSPSLNTMQGGNRQPKIRISEATKRGYAEATPGQSINLSVPNSATRRGRVSDIAQTLDTGMQQHTLTNDSRIRRLTPTECERLQGFPDGWTKGGLSSIMEICVNISPALANLLPKSATVFCTTSDGNDTELQLFRKGWNANADIAISEPLPASSAIGITNLGKDTVMLFNRKEMWNIDELIKPKNIYDETENLSMSKLWRITLDEKLSKEKLSTILTSLHEIMTSKTSTFAKIGENTIGCIIRLNSVVPSYSGGESLSLRMGNIESISDSQRYKCLGNAVTVNVIRDIAERLFPLK